MKSDSTAAAVQRREKQGADLPSYILITPARNEAEFIEQTIVSVTSQSVLPIRWVIVSDGSTDGTDDIVRKYLGEHNWMELVRTPERNERHFAGKVHAFNAGYARVKDLDFDIVGSLDADISFDPDYFDFLLMKFVADCELGVGGTPYREGTVQYDYRFSRPEHVSGACQLFRRECFDAIGGYVPLKAGAVDLTAVVTARMKGWKTRTFQEKYCLHHRKMGTAERRVLPALFKSGYGDYLMGVHPLWQFLRSTYQMSRKPYVLGGGCLLIGYLWGVLKRPEKPVSQEFVKFRGREQMRWLGEYFWRLLGREKARDH